MHFFNPRAIAEKLRDDVLSERDKLGYVIATLVLQLVSGIPTLLAGSQPESSYSLLAVIFFGVIILGGLRSCFDTNAQGDGKQFVERWVCLSVPIAMWTVVLPPFVFTGFFLCAYAATGTGMTQLADRLFPAIYAAYLSFHILHFVMLNHFIAIAASGSAPEEEQHYPPLATP